MGRRPKAGLAAAHRGDAAESGGLHALLCETPVVGAAGNDVVAVVGASGVNSTRSVTEQIATLTQLSLTDLRQGWRRLFRNEPPRLSRDLMTRAIAHRLQEIAHGGLAKASERRLSALTEKLGVDGTIAPPPEARIKPGSRLVREWHGRTHTVEVTEDGFGYEGKSYRSLTKIAFDITGAQWSGPRFFGLTNRRASATVLAGDVSSREENPNG